MQRISGVGVARDQRACDSFCSFNLTRYEIAASPHPAALRASTLPIKGRVVGASSQSHPHICRNPRRLAVHHAGHADICAHQHLVTTQHALVHLDGRGADLAR